MSSNGSKHPILTAIGDEREGTGILCNDPLGLCISSEGAPIASCNLGFLTSMVHLVSQLTDANHSEPLITIETDEASILVKSYDGHMIALKVPYSSTVTVGETSSNLNSSSAKTEEMETKTG
jgi:hypothetical protein